MGGKGGDRRQKKKRLAAKAQQALEPASKKGKASAGDVPWEDRGHYTLVTLEPHQEVLLMGQAQLSVLEGSVCVNGKVLSSCSPAVNMSTAGRTGLAISITALPAATPIIRTSSDPVRFTLTAPKALAAGAAAAQSLKHQMAAAKAASKQQAQGADGEGEEEDDDEEEGEGEGEEGEEERQGRAGGQQPSELSGTSPQVAARAGPQPTTPAGGEGKPEEADVAMTSMFSLFLSSNPAAPLPVRVPQDWQEAIDRICEAASEASQSGNHQGPPIIAICGARNMGKSNLGRLLVNNLLNYSKSVMYLDSDCGQPEFTTPGLVSLTRVDRPVLGPPCTHSRAPVASHYLGDTSAQSDPELYCASVQALVRWYWQHGADARTGQWPPLVVNTHGWIKGVGLDVLAEVLTAVTPTHVVQFMADSSNKSLPPGLFWLKDYQQWPAAPAAAPAAWGGSGAWIGPRSEAEAEVGPGPPPLPCVLIPLRAATQHGHDADAGGAEEGEGEGAEGAATARSAALPGPVAGPSSVTPRAVEQRNLSAADTRALQWHAWARAAVGRDGTWGMYEGEELWQDATRLAAERPLVVSLDDVDVRFLYEQDLPRAQVGHAINGAVVGLACSAAEGQEGSAEGALPPPPTCLGIGVVRAVDMRARLLYILTDLAHRNERRLQKVDTLLVGKLELPQSLLQAGDAAVSPYLALFGLAAEGTGAGGAKSRPTLERSRLMKH